MAAVIEFEGLAYTHPGAAKAVIENLTLSIDAGSFTAIVGGSGVGKSTLLRAAAGLLAPGAGTMHLNLPRVPGRRRRAMVFQDSRLLPWRTVSDNIAYGLETLDIGTTEKAARVAQALRLTGLEELQQRWPHQLSGGQAQRVGIARALAVEPEILLMDEPFGAVDALTRRQLQTGLLQIWQSTRTAVLFVTHDIEEAVYLADRVVVLGGQPARVLENMPIDLPRPRSREGVDFAACVERLSSWLGIS
ncbi:MAG: ABC transporter ATP-binding protein [Janthinobacterium lividum]